MGNADECDATDEITAVVAAMERERRRVVLERCFIPPPIELNHNRLWKYPQSSSNAADIDKSGLVIFVLAATARRLDCNRHTEFHPLEALQIIYFFCLPCCRHR
jgi:hypothetical protein